MEIPPLHSMTAIMLPSKRILNPMAATRSRPGSPHTGHLTSVSCGTPYDLNGQHSLRSSKQRDIAGLQVLHDYWGPIRAMYRTTLVLSHLQESSAPLMYGSNHANTRATPTSLGTRLRRWCTKSHRPSSTNTKYRIKGSMPIRGWFVQVAYSETQPLNLWPWSSGLPHGASRHTPSQSYLPHNIWSPLLTCQKSIKSFNTIPKRSLLIYLK